jgi:hypothetical protein
MKSGLGWLRTSIISFRAPRTARQRGAEGRIKPVMSRPKQSTSGAGSRPGSTVKNLTIDKNQSGKITGNWGVATRCCGGTGRHYGARLPAGYQRQGAQSETIGRQTGRVGSLFRVSRPV